MNTFKTVYKQYSARNKRLKEKNISYKEYLGSDFWKNIRSQLRKHKDYQACYCCGWKENLDIHHIKYKSIFSKKIGHHINTTLPLCRVCHTEVHQICLDKNLSLKTAVRSLKRKMLK